jgi:hypothetical protein
MALTSVSQGIAFLPKGAEREAYALTVEQIKAAARRVAQHPPLQVLRAPLPLSAGAGRRGHCLVAGMRDPSVKKHMRKALMDELDGLCLPVTDADLPRRGIRRRAVDAQDIAIHLVARALGIDTAD